jgi:hypothetical protein
MKAAAFEKAASYSTRLVDIILYFFFVGTNTFQEAETNTSALRF